MADIVIFWGPHWMDEAKAERLVELRTAPTFDQKFNSRLRPGDICTVGRPGQYVGARLKKMRCIQVPDLPPAEASALTAPLERPRTPDERRGDADEEAARVASEHAARTKRGGRGLAGREAAQFRAAIRDEQDRRAVTVAERMRKIDLDRLDPAVREALDRREPVTLAWSELTPLIRTKGL